MLRSAPCSHSTCSRPAARFKPAALPSSLCPSSFTIAPTPCAIASTSSSAAEEPLLRSRTSTAKRTRVTCAALNPFSKGRKPSPQTQVSSSLLSVVKDEIKFEAEAYRKDELLLDPAPNEFSVDDTTGENGFYLLKKFQDEVIVVQVRLESQGDDDKAGDEDDDDDDEGDDDDDRQAAAPGSIVSLREVTAALNEVGGGMPVVFRVSITKGDTTMMFECVGDEEDVTIRRVTHLTDSDAADYGDDADDQESSEYKGPDFDNLDDTLQQAFHDYLDERGINSELCEYMTVLLEDKRAREYQGWLKKVESFIA